MTNTTNDKILDRVKKLLELSKSANEHEAAQAAARAAELMQAHEITEAMLEVTRQGEDSVERVSEQIVDRTCTDDDRKVAWRMHLVAGVARANDCRVYSYGGTYHLVGRDSAVAAATYVVQWLFHEVDRLADEAWLQEGADLAAVGQRPRAWKNAFRVGAAVEIRSRLTAQKADADQALESKVAFRS